MKHAHIAAAVVALAIACDDPADDVEAATVVDSEEPTGDIEPAERAAARESLTFSNEGSTIGFVGSKVTASHEGGFNEFSGTIELDPAAPENSSVEVTIQTASLFVDDDDLADHLKSDDFFDVEEYPQATFRTTSIAAGGEGDATHTLTGELSLHGQTKTIRFPATVTVTDAAVTAEAEFSIDRTEFGMTYPGMADNLIRDRVVIELDLNARR